MNLHKNNPMKYAIFPKYVIGAFMNEKEYVRLGMQFDYA